MIELYLKRTDAAGPWSQSAAVWELLRELLAAKGFERMPEVVKNTAGKPYFKGNPIYFSLSHTAGAVAVVISDSEIGVDLQIVRPISRRVAERYLATDSDNPRELTRRWVEFESYGKFLGCGIPITLPDRPHVFSFYEIGELMLAVCSETENATEPIWL